MSVALLLITHTPFGKATLEATIGTLGTLPLPIKVMDVERDCDVEQARQQAGQLLDELDQGDGVLLLTDLYGATPSNIASSLMEGNHRLILVSGLNLAMLIRVMNYPGEDLPGLAQKAFSGGQSGVSMHPTLAQQEQLNHA